MSYSILKRQEFVFGEYKILPIRGEDKFLIMQWRNEQLDILRQQDLLTSKQQAEYFQNVVIPDFEALKPRQILFSYFFQNELIGYGGLVHIQWMDQRAEVSFLLQTDRNKDIHLFKHDYGVYLRLIKEVAFQEMRFNKLTTEAFDLRPYLIEALEENGFIQEGRLRRHNLIGGKFVDSLLHGCFAEKIQ